MKFTASTVAVTYGKVLGRSREGLGADQEKYGGKIISNQFAYLVVFHSNPSIGNSHSISEGV